MDDTNFNIVIDDPVQYVVRLNEQGPAGPAGEKGDPGERGTGINSIIKTSSSGLIDIYTITYTDGLSTTFQVKNGNGINDIELLSPAPGQDVLTDRYQINYTNGTSTTFDVKNGNGIYSIAKTSTSGLVDTYTITFDNGDTKTYTVTNGFSPTASVSKVGGVSTLTVTDQIGTTTTNINDGDAATIAVGTVATGLPGSAATVTNSGTQYNAVFDFSIPQGEMGQLPDQTGHSGDYLTTDGTDTSWSTITIPTVNNATLTIQKNGTTVNTFTANASSNVTANITVPTDVSDLTNTTLANKDLSNLSQTGNDRLHALKSYADNGELLTDAEGLQDVKNYAHSTFDLSKFTVVGSPNITDDGIASDFEGSNRIKAIFDYNGGILKVTQGFYFTSDSDGGNIFFLANSSNGGVLRAYLSPANGLNFYGGSASTPVQFASNEYSPNEGDFIILQAKLNDNSTATITVTNTTRNITLTKTSGANINLGTLSATNNNLYIGNSNGYERYAGKIDLKYTDISESGIQVFSGNKTGIDTIKPDDYTVVGTPTISDDGIASGFSSSNYVTTNYTGTTTDFEVLIPFTVQTLDATHNILGQMLLLYANGRFVSNIGDGAKYGNVYATVNTNYLAKIKLKNGYHSLNISTDNGVTWTEVFNVANANSYTFNNITIGCYNNYNYFKGLVNLNGVKFIVNGNLVYQPCLKIPYTESKTGSKVVYSAYRPRVLDAYTQLGSYNAYTLDEENGNFTNPCGEVYGMINNLDKAIGDIGSVLDSINGEVI